ncbi:hypothetical protein MUK42_00905 [Musa troglodytarum]|uniref:Uncharacterized protein n=1 Tax=Musa troglodytarum TaxID=320322 RepID=A0A9E7EQJ1_9LILI|nr:hypothetical protein MUK42_00905 [Musa troglodytarum]
MGESSARDLLLRRGFGELQVCFLFFPDPRLFREMGNHHHHHHHHHHEGVSPYDDPFLACCCCPCFLVSSILRGFGSCIFMACYPIFQCLGLDEYSQRRHHHHHSHFH